MGVLGLARSSNSASVDPAFVAERELSREEHLILAIIDRALQDAYAIRPNGGSSLQKYPHLLSRISQDAQDWLTNPSTEPLSYRWCCDMVRMNPTLPRDTVARYRKDRQFVRGLDC